MFKFSVNLSMLFQELPFWQRFGAAAQSGFNAVEFMFPYEYPTDELKKELAAHHLKLVLFNLPAGNWAAGERGIAVDPSRRTEFQAGVQKAAEYAKALDVPQVNCLVGKKMEDIPVAQQRRTLVENLRYAADALKTAGVRLLVEPLNNKDMQGFALNTTKQTLDVLDEVDHDNVFLQYDVYHAQRMEGELARILRSNLPRISHIQIADNPGRHEPGTGEINYRWLLNEFAAVGYDRYVGLEYIPTQTSEASLRWLADYGYSL